MNMKNSLNSFEIGYKKQKLSMVQKQNQFKIIQENIKTNDRNQTLQKD